MVIPALPQIAEDLDLTSEAMTQLLVSTFVLGWGLGPLLLAPLSESYGRRALLNGGHAMFLAVNTLCAIERNGTRFLILRFIAGFVGSAPLAVSFFLSTSLVTLKEMIARNRCAGLEERDKLRGMALDRELTVIQDRERYHKRPMESRGARSFTSSLHCRTIDRTHHRPHCWRFHRREHVLAMDVLRLLNLHRSLFGRWPRILTRDFCTRDPDAETALIEFL